MAEKNRTHFYLVFVAEHVWLDDIILPYSRKLGFVAHDQNGDFRVGIVFLEGSKQRKNIATI